jgi:hypothetical protein
VLARTYVEGVLLHRLVHVWGGGSGGGGSEGRGAQQTGMARGEESATKTTETGEVGVRLVSAPDPSGHRLSIASKSQVDFKNKQKKSQVRG